MGPPTVCLRTSADGELGCSGAVGVSTRSGARLHWHGCTDPESGIGHSVVTITTISAEAPTTLTYPLGLKTAFALPSLLTGGNQAFTANVACYNRAGLASAAGALGPIRFDETPPTIGEGALQCLGATSSTMSYGNVRSFPILYLSNATANVEIDTSKLADLESDVASARLVVSFRGSTVERPPIVDAAGPMALSAPLRWIGPYPAVALSFPALASPAQKARLLTNPNEAANLGITLDFVIDTAANTNTISAQVAGPTGAGGLELQQVGRVEGGVGAGGAIGGGTTYMLGGCELADLPKAERVMFMSDLTATALPVAAPAAAGRL